MESGVNYAKLYGDEKIKINIMKAINLKKLFTLFWKTAKDTINALKENRPIHWEKKDVEGRAVLVANIDTEVTI